MTIESKFWKLTRWARAGRFWLFLLLAFLAWAGFGRAEAFAQSGAQCGAGQNCNREQAYQQCIAFAQWRVSNFDQRSSVHTVDSPRCTTSANASAQTGTYSCLVTVYNSSGSVNLANANCAAATFNMPHPIYGTGGFSWASSCPEGLEWNETRKSCFAGCSNVENLGPNRVTGSFNACSNGCQFQQGGAVSVCLGGGAEMSCFAQYWEPTGNECQAGDGQPSPHDPDKETCRTTGGGWNECVRPDGTHCVTGAKGTRMCWQPGETGQRNDTANIEWADRVPTGETPTPPANIENPTQETTTADKGGVSGDGVGGSFVIGGGSGIGNSGGQNNTGRGGSGDGDEGDNEHGAPGSGLGNVYESDGKTVADIFGVFRARAEQAPVIDAATGFLEVSAGSGCPVFTLAATQFWDAMTFDYHCSGPLADNLALGAYLLMAIAAFIAFRVAFH